MIASFRAQNSAVQLANRFTDGDLEHMKADNLF
jgi:hypothetical protein